MKKLLSKVFLTCFIFICIAFVSSCANSGTVTSNVKTTTNNTTVTSNVKTTTNNTTVTSNVKTTTNNTSEKRYTVTWKNDNGVTLEVDRNVKKGSMPEYNGKTPTKSSTSQYNYTFSGWSPTISEVSKDVTYKAQYTQTLVKYKISWRNEDGSLIKTTEVEYGKYPRYDGDTPTKDSSDMYDYTFSGWSPSLKAVTSDTSYKAKFSNSVRFYNISFVNEDGSLLYSDYIQAGKSISSTILNNIKPKKDKDEDYSYQFSGWYPSVSTVLKDQVYTAVYKKTELPYTFKFNLNGGECDSIITDKKTDCLDKSDFKFDLHKGDKSFRGWMYNGILIFGYTGTQVGSIKEFSNVMTFDAVYKDEYMVTINYQIGSFNYSYDNLPDELKNVSKSGFFDAHSNVNLYANPSENYVFVGWYKKTTRLSNNSNYEYGLYAEDVVLTAKFSERTYYFSASTNNSEWGKIQRSGSTLTDKYSANIAWGSTISLFAKPDEGDEFLGWYNIKDNSLVSTSNTLSFVMPQNTCKLEARFASKAIVNYTIEHYQQNINDANYSLYETEYGEGVKGTSTNAIAKNYEGFTVNSFNQAIIIGDGSTVIKIYYNRNLYTLKYNKYYYRVIEKDGQINPIICYTSTYKYGKGVNVSSTDEYLGSTYLGIYENDILLTNDTSYNFVMPAHDVTIDIKRELLPEMEPFLFYSSENALRIDGVRDKNIKEIVVPSYVTEISEGAFKGLYYLEKITISFLGLKKQKEENSKDYHFGSIFSVTKGKTVNYSSGISSTSPDTYRLPSSLKTVIITEITSIPKFAFSDFESNNVEILVLPNTISSIDSGSFSPSTLNSFNSLVELKFNGTIEEWNLIDKGSNWYSNLIDNVTCIDGIVAL